MLLSSVKSSFEVFVWTEAFGCEEILKPFILSYQRHNSIPLNVLGRKNLWSTIVSVINDFYSKQVAIQK